MSQVAACQLDSCPSRTLLRRQGRFEVLPRRMQAGRARVLAERAVDALGSQDPDEALLILALGAAWLRSPVPAAADMQAGSSQAGGPPRDQVQSMVRVAVADTLEVLDLTGALSREHALAGRLGPVVEALETVLEVGVPLQVATGRREWFRIAGHLHVRRNRSRPEAVAPPRAATPVRGEVDAAAFSASLSLHPFSCRSPRHEQNRQDDAGGVSMPKKRPRV